MLTMALSLGTAPDVPLEQTGRGRGGRAATRRAGVGSPDGRGHRARQSAAVTTVPQNNTNWGSVQGQARSGSHPQGCVVSEQSSVPGSAGLLRPVTGR